MALIIFLLPTLAMFYFLAFIKLVISVLALQICLLVAQISLSNFPFHLFKFVLNNPYILPNSINIEPQLANQNHMRMIPIRTNIASIFKKLGSEFKKILKVASPGNVIKSIIWGDNLLLIMRNLLQTLQRDQEKGAAKEGEEKAEDEHDAQKEEMEAVNEFVFIKELF